MIDGAAGHTGVPGQPAARADVERELAVRAALRQVRDPENDMDVVTLGLIRGVAFDREGVVITMILTSPFCPYADHLIQQVGNAARTVAAGQVRVVMGEEIWTPAMIEGDDLAEWGLV